MDNISIDVLMTEDNPDVAQLTKRELKQSNLANNLIHIKDGEEAIRDLGLYWLLLNHLQLRR